MKEILAVKDIFKKHKMAFLFGPMLKMVEAVFDLLIPLFMKCIIDLTNNYLNGQLPTSNMNSISTFISNVILKSGNWVSDVSLNYALIGGVYILLMGILGFLTTMVTQYVAAKTSVSCGKEIRDNIYKKILSLSKSEKEKVTINKLTTVLNSDTYQVQQGVLIFIRLIVRAPFIILGALVISLILDWRIGLVFIFIVPLILLVIFVIMKRSSEKYLRIQEDLDGISEKTSDVLNGEKVVRAFNAEERENSDFEKKNAIYKNDAIKVSKLNSLINPLTFAITAVATAFLLMFGGMSIFNDVESYTQASSLATTIITEVSYLTMIFTTTVQLSNVVMILTKARASEKRVDEVLLLKPEIVANGNKAYSIEEGQELFSFDNVYMRYQEGNYTLKDISFKLNKGQSLGIIGPTGSGKSSILALLVRFVDRQQGVIKYKGEDIKDYDVKALRSEVSLVLQKAVLFKGTIRTNLLMGNSKASDEEIERALKDSMAYEFVSSYPDYLEHEVRENGSNFSGGQRQRLAIARGLLAAKECIILDDSTSALDLLTDKALRENLSLNHRDLTKIIVSQRVSTIKDCDVILVVDGGKIIASGTHSELLSSCSLYSETYSSQAKKEGL